MFAQADALPFDWSAFWLPYWVTVAGNVSVLLFDVVKAYEVGRALPARFRRPYYILARLGMAACSGVLGGVTTPRNLPMAFAVGATFQIILSKSLRDPPPRDDSDDEVKPG